MALATPAERPEFGKGLPVSSGAGSAPKLAAGPNALNRGAMQQYQRAQVETASPTRLVVLLYDGAIRFSHKAREAMLKGDLETQHINLIRVQRIVGELLGSLNREAGGEVAAELNRVYTYLLTELVKANLYDSLETLDHAIWVLDELRASWVEIDRMGSGDTTVSSAAGITGQGQQQRPAPQPGQASSADGAGLLLSRTARLINSQRAAGQNGSDSRLGDRLV